MSAICHQERRLHSSVPTFDECRSNLDEIVLWFQREGLGLLANEATTRFKLIDRLLLEALAWDRDEFAVEAHEDGTYTDYELGKPRRLIVEAKRESIGFTLPAGCRSGVLPLRTLLDDSAIREAIEQALRYGCPICSSLKWPPGGGAHCEQAGWNLADARQVSSVFIS